MKPDCGIDPTCRSRRNETLIFFSLLSSSKCRRRLKKESRYLDSCKRGAVLLEVVLALTLFAAAAAIIGAAIHSAINGVERQKLQTHATDLAISVLSEIQMGLRTVEAVGPESFDTPFERW